jgi:hypothetical protein
MDDLEEFASAEQPASLRDEHELVVPLLRDAFAKLAEAAEQASSAATPVAPPGPPNPFLERIQFVAALNDARPEFLALKRRERRAGFRAAAERLGVGSCLPPAG